MADTRKHGSPAVTFAQGHGLDGPWGMVAGEVYFNITWKLWLSEEGDSEKETIWKYLCYI